MHVYVYIYVHIHEVPLMHMPVCMSICLHNLYLHMSTYMPIYGRCGYMCVFGETCETCEN